MSLLRRPGEMTAHYDRLLAKCLTLIAQKYNCSQNMMPDLRIRIKNFVQEQALDELSLLIFVVALKIRFDKDKTATIDSSKEVIDIKTHSQQNIDVYFRSQDDRIEADIKNHINELLIKTNYWIGQKLQNRTPQIDYWRDSLEWGVSAMNDENTMISKAEIIEWKLLNSQYQDIVLTVDLSKSKEEAELKLQQYQAGIMQLASYDLRGGENRRLANVLLHQENLNSRWTNLSPYDIQHQNTQRNSVRRSIKKKKTNKSKSFPNQNNDLSSSRVPIDNMEIISTNSQESFVQQNSKEKAVFHGQQLADNDYLQSLLQNNWSKVQMASKDNFSKIKRIARQGQQVPCTRGTVLKVASMKIDVNNLDKKEELWRQEIRDCPPEPIDQDRISHDLPTSIDDQISDVSTLRCNERISWGSDGINQIDTFTDLTCGTGVQQRFTEIEHYVSNLERLSQVSDLHQQYLDSSHWYNQVPDQEPKMSTNNEDWRDIEWNGIFRVMRQNLEGNDNLSVNSRGVIDVCSPFISEIFEND